MTLRARYRVSFLRVYPGLFPGKPDRIRFERHFFSREEAEESFRDELDAYQLDRWEPATNEWVLLNLRTARIGWPAS